jgi:mitochondrial fission protein ELM1
MTRCWLVTDEAAGNLRQAEALAQAMGLEAQRWTVRLRAPWSWWAPRFERHAAGALPPAFVLATRNAPPEIAIGCGRAGALATAWLRATCACYAVQVLDPRANRRAWNLIITPAHDALRGPDTINSIGALNVVTPGRLAAAALAHAELARLPTPRTAVLVGGSTRAARLDAAWLASLHELLAAWQARDGGSFLVCTSRRTSPALVARLRQAFAVWPGAVWAPGDAGTNPYLGFLGHAQRVVVSPDSVNLLSEACATGKPVYVHAPRGVRGKLAQFHRELLETGHVRPLRAVLDAWTPEPLRETEAIGAEVLRRFAQWRAEDAGSRR